MTRKTSLGNEKRVKMILLIKEPTGLIKSILQGDEVMRAKRDAKQKAFFGLASETAERSKAEMREMFIKCFTLALHNYQFCAI